jgi:hypothetical protein
MTGGAPRARLAARGVQDDGKTGCADHTIPRGQLPGGQLLLRQHLHKLRTAVRSLLVGTKRSSLEPAAAGRCHACSLSSIPQARRRLRGAPALLAEQKNSY